MHAKIHEKIRANFWKLSVKFTEICETMNDNLLPSNHILNISHIMWKNRMNFSITRAARYNTIQYNTIINSP